MAESPPPETPPVSNEAIRQNVETVARIEEEFTRNRSTADRIADAIGSFTGDIRFVLLEAAAFIAWIVVNSGVVPWIRPFDPYPFMLLSMGVSVEAIFLSTFVLMKQNRMSRRSEQREHLDLQINLLSEREMTLVLQLLRRISARLDIPVSNEELDELSKRTSLEALASELKEKLPDE